MSRRTLANATAALLVAAATVPALVTAQAYGRLILEIKDPEDRPLAGVTVTATCGELPSFSEVATTKKKGKASIVFVDTSRVYTITVEKEGFMPVRFELKPEPGLSTGREVTLQPRGADAPPPPAERPRGKLSPAETLYNEGVELLQAGDLDGAEAKLDEALARNDKLAPAHAAMSALLLERGDLDGAIAAANHLLELAPDHPRAYVTLYEANRQKGDAESAQAALDSLARLGQGQEVAVLLYNQGVEALKSGEIEAAKNDFETAVAADPTLLAPLVGLARIDLVEGRFASAVERAEEAASREPDNFGALSIRYEAYTALGDSDKANQAFDDLAAADPKKVAKLLYDRGIELFNAGDSRSAIEAFERTLQADPEIIKAHYHLGLAYVNTGASDRAKEHLLRFLELAPDDPDAASATEMLGYLGN